MAFNDEYRDNDPESAAQNDELEQYGVWVKVGPEEISAEEGETIDDEYELHDLNSNSVLSADATELTDEEEELLGELEHDLDSLGDDEHITDFDSGFTEEPTSDAGSSAVTGSDITPADLDVLEELDIDDLDSLPDLPSLEESTPEPAVVLNESEQIPDLDTDLEDLENLDIDEDLLLDSEDLDSFDELDVDSMIEEDLAELDTAEDAAEEIQLDTVVEEDMNASSEETATSEEPEEIPFLEQEIEDIDLEDLEQNDYGEDLQELDQIQEGSDTDSLEELSGFDDLQALEDDLSPEPEEISMPADAPHATPESAEILSKIEQELLSIKSELSSLKDELSSMRSMRDSLASSLPPSQEPGTEAHDLLISAEDEASFFEDDEDETIALTGDELDNILNTADITEESGTAESAPEEEEEETETFDDTIDLDLDELSSLETLPEVTPAEDDLLVNEPDILDEEDQETDQTIPEIPAAEEDLVEDMTEDQDILEDDEPLPEIDESDILDIDLEEISADEESTPDEAEPIDLLDDSGLEELEVEIDEDDDLISESLTAVSVPEEEEILFEEEDELEDESIGDLLEPEETENVSVAEIEPLESADESPEEIPLTAAAPDEKDNLDSLPDGLKNEIKSVLSYMDQLLESLPEEKIQEFANSDHFDVYKRLFDELGLNS